MVELRCAVVSVGMVVGGPGSPSCRQPVGRRSRIDPCMSCWFDVGRLACGLLIVVSVFCSSLVGTRLRQPPCSCIFHNSRRPLTSRPVAFFFFFSMHLPPQPHAHHSPCPAAQAAALGERGQPLLMDTNTLHDATHKYKAKNIKNDE